jgi:hypothetical protein
MFYTKYCLSNIRPFKSLVENRMPARNQQPGGRPASAGAARGPLPLLCCCCCCAAAAAVLLLLLCCCCCCAAAAAVLLLLLCCCCCCAAAAAVLLLLLCCSCCCAAAGDAGSLHHHEPRLGAMRAQRGCLVFKIWSALFVYNVKFKSFAKVCSIQNIVFQTSGLSKVWYKQCARSQPATWRPTR